MLSHEMRLLKNRIPKEDHPNKMFFTFADTVATIDFAKKIHGPWLDGNTFPDQSRRTLQ